MACFIRSGKYLQNMKQSKYGLMSPQLECPSLCHLQNLSFVLDYYSIFCSSSSGCIYFFFHLLLRFISSE